MEYEFSDVVDIPLLQDMAEKLYLAAGIPVGIIDLKGDVKVQAGWQSICTDFHRVCPESCKNCKLSDSYIFEHLHENKYIEYKCLNNMWDIAMPIRIEGRHIATLFVGQFFYPEDDIDVETFKKQAEKFEFDTEKYLEALKKVPVFPRDQIHNMLEYYQNYISVLADIGLQNLQKQIYISKIQQYADIVEAMKAGLLVFCLQKMDGKTELVLQAVNKAGLELLATDREEIVGKTIHDIFLDIDGQDVFDRYIDIAVKKQNNDYIEICCNNCDKSVSWYSFNAFAIPEKCVGVMFENITDRKMAEERILYLSYHDQLTGLHNRRYFEDEMKQCDKPHNYPISIIMADVNGLKLANDSFGHQFGDQLLNAVADSLRSCCMEDEIIARIGGDEFVILLNNTDLKTAEAMTERIISYIHDKAVGPVNVSIAFGSATKTDESEEIHETLRRAEDRMYRMKLLEGPSMRSHMLTTIMSTLHAKNQREKIHAEQVAELCVKFGHALGLSENDINEIRTTALLHDIGKIGISEYLLNKSGGLTDEEYAEIKKHCEIGHRILKESNDMDDISKYVLYHHERWDGKGYPSGISMEAIPLQSRMISIVDAFDAITNERSYRPARSIEVAAKEIADNSGKQFDPQLVEVFLEKVIIR